MSLEKHRIFGLIYIFNIFEVKNIDEIIENFSLTKEKSTLDVHPVLNGQTIKKQFFFEIRIFLWTDSIREADF